MREKEPKTTRQRGAVLILFTFCLVVLCMFAAWAIDIGLALTNERQIQFGADAAAQAGAALLDGSSSITPIDTEARAIAAQNSVTNAQVTAVQCGTWSSLNKTFTASNSCSSANAVRVTAQRAVGTIFARVMGFVSLNPSVEAIAMSEAGGVNCIRPFGVDFDLLTNVPVNSTFSVSNQNSGNWGKLGLNDVNMSSGSTFEEWMLNDACTGEAAINEVVETGPGFGGSIAGIFDQVMSSGVGDDMTIALTSDFPNGRGDVTLLEFIRVRLDSQRRRGQNWTATFTLLERNVAPRTDGGGSDDPVLVR